MTVYVEGIDVWTFGKLELRFPEWEPCGDGDAFTVESEKDALDLRDLVLQECRTATVRIEDSE